FCPPSAARRMIRARSTWRAGSNLARACCSKMERCSVLKVTGGAMRILALHCEGRARAYNRHYLWRTTLAGIDFEALPDDQRRQINALPAMIYHGVMGEFLRSRGDGRLIEVATVLLPPI